ncbi:MAG TPA: hypothetical protein VNV25_25400 [Gemmatimonadaceae bacterium]|jgi:hypothetical protein|nr:hypothetical protein [Gemmatimonadaceae bacterium]
MASKDTRAANGAAGKTDLLLFDPTTLVIVEDEGSALTAKEAHALDEELDAGGVLAPTKKPGDLACVCCAKGRPS